MGCDIHSMVEVFRSSLDGLLSESWYNAGSGDDVRNYTMFHTLAGVRYRHDKLDLQPLFPPRGVPADACEEYRDHIEANNGDAHSASWITLVEVNEHAPNRPELADLQQLLERIREFWNATPEHIRMCFFFDN